MKGAVVEENYGEVVIMGPNPEKCVSAESVKVGRHPSQLYDEELHELKQSILIMIPHRPGLAFTKGMLETAGMWGNQGMRWGTLQDPQGGFVEVTRGKMVRNFLEYANDNPEVKYLVMIDADEEVEWDAPLKLAAHGLPIVSGIVCGISTQRGIFACFMSEDESGIKRFSSIRDTQKLPATGIKKIPRCGTGLLCVRRDVLEVMLDSSENPFQVPNDAHEEGVREGNVIMSEDMAFCQRAERFGFDIYVDFSVHARHHKGMMVSWPQERIDEKISADDWKPSKFDYRGVT